MARGRALSPRPASRSRQLLSLLTQEKGLVVGDNEPYFVSDATDFTIPIHGERRGLPHVLIEIRQDLIANESGQHKWALCWRAVAARLIGACGD